MTKYTALENFIQGQTVLDGSLSFAEALNDAREQLRNDYTASRIWKTAPVDVIKLAATVITTQDTYRLRKENFYSLLVDDALDILFFEDETFQRRLKTLWKENAEKAGNYSA